MKKRYLIGGALAAGVLGFSGWLLSLPPAPGPKEAPTISADETAALLAALKPPKRARPLIAIIGVNAGTETTDYLMPYGILSRADVADVRALATEPGPVTLYPALTVEPDMTVAAFDTEYPNGADYVIVPAMHRDDDPDALAWIKGQAAKGATIIGVCVGATVVAETGLLDGKRATTHWYSVDGMRKRHPEIQYVPDRRMVADQGVVTTTGISASMPMSLTLIEAIGGREKAEEVAADLGLEAWDLQHDSGAFTFTRPFAATAVGNRLAFWNHETLGFALTPALDDVALALVADAWSRTYKSRAVTFAATGDARVTRNGLRVIPDEVRASWPEETLLPPIDTAPAQALDSALAGIAERYGERTADFVAMQLEYPR